MLFDRKPNAGKASLLFVAARDVAGAREGAAEWASELTLAKSEGRLVAELGANPWLAAIERLLRPTAECAEANSARAPVIPYSASPSLSRSSALNACSAYNTECGS